MGDLGTAVLFLVIAVLIAAGGVRLGMLLAPSIGRLEARGDVEPADGPPDAQPPDAQPPDAEEPRDDA